MTGDLRQRFNALLLDLHRSGCDHRLVDRVDPK